jgi:hypothetical protein
MMGRMVDFLNVKSGAAFTDSSSEVSNMKISNFLDINISFIT